MLSRVSYTELFELHDEVMSSIGVGIRGLSGIDDNRLLKRLDTADEEASETDRCMVGLPPHPTPLSQPALVSLSAPSVATVLPEALLVLLAVDPVFVSIPATGFCIVAGLCLSRLNRRAGEACTRKVSKRAFCETERPLCSVVVAGFSRLKLVSDRFRSAQATPFSPSAAWMRFEKASLREGVR